MFCVFLLNSIMTSSASKWTLPVVNILIMLITSCDSIDSILQQHPCPVPKAIALTFCRKLYTRPWPFLRKLLDRIFTAHLHSGHICMGPEWWSAPLNTYFGLSWGVFSWAVRENTALLSPVKQWKFLWTSQELWRHSWALWRFHAWILVHLWMQAPVLVSILCYSRPSMPTLQDHVGCQKNRIVCQFLILGWVKCLLKCLS